MQIFPFLCFPTEAPRVAQKLSVMKLPRQYLSQRGDALRRGGLTKSPSTPSFTDAVSTIGMAFHLQKREVGSISAHSPLYHNLLLRYILFTKLT